MAWSFDGTGFEAMYSPRPRKIKNREYRLDLPPGADHDVIQFLGTHSGQWRMTILVTAAQRSAIETKYESDTIGDLIDRDGTNYSSHMILEYSQQRADNTGRFLIDIVFVARPA